MDLLVATTTQKTERKPVVAKEILQTGRGWKGKIEEVTGCGSQAQSRPAGSSTLSTIKPMATALKKMQGKNVVTVSARGETKREPAKVRISSRRSPASVQLRRRRYFSVHN
jgi:hypothetical protein